VTALTINTSSLLVPGDKLKVVLETSGLILLNLLEAASKRYI